MKLRAHSLCHLQDTKAFEGLRGEEEEGNGMGLNLFTNQENNQD